VNRKAIRLGMSEFASKLHSSVHCIGRICTARMVCVNEKILITLDNLFQSNANSTWAMKHIKQDLAFD
jgi:hypothetical protein